MELARITSKGQMTLSKRIREAARLAAGDVVSVEVEDGRVTLRKLVPGGDAYLRGMQETLTEWHSAEDDHAWRDL